MRETEESNSLPKSSRYRIERHRRTAEGDCNQKTQKVYEILSHEKEHTETLEFHKDQSYFVPQASSEFVDEWKQLLSANVFQPDHLTSGEMHRTFQESLHSPHDDNLP